MKIKISRNFIVPLTIDTVIMAGCYYFSYLIRFDFTIPDWAVIRFSNTLAYVLIFKFLCLYFFDVYRGMWRYTSLNDLFDIVKSTTAATMLTIVIILFVTRFEKVSRSVFIIDWCLTVMGLIAVRVITRLCFEEFTRDVGFKSFVSAFQKIFNKKAAQKGRGMVIVGAGDLGQRICREFKENPNVTSYVIGFLDDDVAKIGRKIHGVPVLSSIDDLVHTTKLWHVDEVIIAISNAGAERMRQIVALCRQSDVDFKTFPDMGEVIDGKISIKAIRDVEYRDLLGREPVKLDRDQIGNYLGKKTVIVTGAGGSIGTGLCRQICRYHPNKIILFERAESPLYEIDLELKKNFSKVNIAPVLGDIQNQNELDKVFKEHGPNIVFHAAAYKHVPMLENHPWKAVENNVTGTCNLIRAARKFDCERFVFVSTDKAVNPTNVMGQASGYQSSWCSRKTRIKKIISGSSQSGLEMSLAVSEVLFPCLKNR